LLRKSSPKLTRPGRIRREWHEIRTGSLCHRTEFGNFASLYREQAQLSPEFPPADWELLRETAADEEGRFLFQLLRHEIDGAPAAHCYRADVESGRSGAETSVWWTMGITRDVYLDRVHRWDEGEISIIRTVDGHSLWAPPGPMPASEADSGSTGHLFSEDDAVAYEWELTALGQPLWRAEKAGEPFVADEFLLEDFDVAAHANMLSYLAPPELQILTNLDGYFELAAGPSVPIPVETPRVPVSRGAVCSAGPKRFDPCTATDGKLDLAVFDLSVQVGSVFIATALVLELPTAARPSLVIFRDLQTQSSPHLTIEGSADGEIWSPLGSFRQSFQGDMVSAYEFMTAQMTIQARQGRSGYFRMELTPPTEPIKQIRLRNEAVFAVREISFFE
jgi:hypothetical protein